MNGHERIAEPLTTTKMTGLEAINLTSGKPDSKIDQIFRTGFIEEIVFVGRMHTVLSQILQLLNGF